MLGELQMVQFAVQFGKQVPLAVRKAPSVQFLHAFAERQISQSDWQISGEHLNVLFREASK